MIPSFLKPNSIQGFFELFGAIVLLSLFFKYFSKHIFKLIDLPFKKTLIQRYGANSWAIVTGGSDGIGRGFCEELAKEGFNIALMARNKEKLENVAKDLQKINPKIETRVIVVDFKESHKHETLQSLIPQFAGLDVSILVNNVGTDVIGKYEEIPEKQELDMMIINIYPLVRLTKAIIPQMLKRDTRSAIINIGSTSGTRPMPYFSVYSATKAFNDFFSKALSVEYRKKIDILSVRPMFVSTALTYRKKVELDTVSPNMCARGALDDLGYTRETCGHWIHNLLAPTLLLIPDFIFDRVIYKSGIEPEILRRKEAVLKLQKKE